MSKRDPAEWDRWEMFADATDLTIEGQRLIAREILYEVTLLWRWVLSWLRDPIRPGIRRGSIPPV